MLMPDSAGSDHALQTFIISVPLVLGASLAAIAALAYGVTWKTVLHWSGESLLVIGILFAAKGIMDVRREWTALPGISGRMRGYWNRLLRRIPILARILPPFTKRVTASVTIGFMAHRPTVGPSDWGTPPSNAGYEERLAWLEARMSSADERIKALDTRIDQEIPTASYEERAARESDIKVVRESMADLAGGGLRLQAWGVVCLLVGTILTAIW